MQATEDSAVQDFLQILEEHRKNCERQGKYVEADIAKNRLEELKLHEENRRRVSIEWNMIEIIIVVVHILDRKQCVLGK